MYAFSAAEKLSANRNASEAESMSGTKPMWESAQTHMDPCTFKKAATHKGVTYQLTVADGENASILKKKILTLHSAIERVQAAGIMFTDADVQEFRVTAYGGNGSLARPPSRGVVWFSGPGAAKPKVLFQMGSRISTHEVATDKGAILGGGAIGGKGTAPRVVADRFYDYYKGTLTVSAKDRSALVQTFHELGHIFHQLMSPTLYWIGADVAMGRVSTEKKRAWTHAHQTMLNRVDAMKITARTYVSQYAGNGQPNEFVAEVFSGIMMGVPWDQIDPSVLQMYAHLGGPIPPQARTIARLDDFVAQTCNCTGGNGGKVVYYT